MFVFEWIEETRLALWVGESLWGYPVLLSLHIIGLASVVGIFTMLNFRLLGIVKEVDFEPLATVFGIAWIGLTINAVSGLALFASQATIFITNIPFHADATKRRQQGNPLSASGQRHRYRDLARSRLGRDGR